ncbi:MAG: SUMF1/EgtB/PvdO family nonheme iron enzyme [Bacteroidales bacterium]|nr:SUMF1/EgtB/PvdO family nonheme iron enzyme [Bacteroidales bacterium]MCF8457409.1 SUMF1/EgtB/PvdO family nonheme iron enzyme [Bacteroidales bacterium]
MSKYRIFFCSVLILFFFSQDVFPQYSNGIYVKYRDQRRVEIYNHDLNSYFHNSHFRINQKINDSNKIKPDSSFIFLKQKYATKPPKVNDCVYFNPLDSYIENYSVELDRKSYFYLNKCYESPSSEVRIILPYSLRMYIDTSEITLIPGQLELVLDSNFKAPLDEYLQPFYFRKFEVSNAEYREFVSYVKDSIARTILYEAGQAQFGNTKSGLGSDRLKTNIMYLNWEIKIPWDSEILDSSGLYLQENERFYRRREINPERLNYRKFIDDSTTINIYPDTLSWTDDFHYSFNEPFTNCYFWHPAYGDYPVVGITYWQALAYLDWRTKRHQKLLDEKGINWIVTYDLPTEIEWDFASTSEMIDKQTTLFTNNYGFLTDQTWVCDLKLKSNAISIIEKSDSAQKLSYITKRKDQLFDLLKRQVKFDGNYVIDVAIFTHTVKIIRKKEKNVLVLQNQDDLGICYLGGNVSEWLKNSYSEQWGPIFELRQNLLSTFEEEDVKLLAQIEAYYDKGNDKNGKLVRGANWYDERFSNRFGKNTEGAQTKLFVNPDSAYCTLGFRYVVHFEPK